MYYDIKGRIYVRIYSVCKALTKLVTNQSDALAKALVINEGKKIGKRIQNFLCKYLLIKFI